MKSNKEIQMQRANFIGPTCIFLSWIFLRFFLFSKTREVLFFLIKPEGVAKTLLNHAAILIEALLLFTIYWYFRRRKQLGPVRIVKPNKDEIKLGVLSGIAISILTIPVALHFGMKIYPQFSAPELIGNIFSNAGEEMIYRGIIYVAMLSLFRSGWLSVGISAIAFGAAHWDLPYLFQVYISVVGIILGWMYIRTENLWTPYIGHMIADFLCDLMFH